MKIKALMKKRIKAIEVKSMTNERYKKACATTLRAKINDIKTYSDSLNETGKFYVR